MTLRRTAERAMAGLIVAALFATPALTQDGYRTPPEAITKILDAPGPPAVSVSSDRKWLLMTTSDIPETTIAEIAEPTLFLAGRRFQTQPRQRIDVEGVRNGGNVRYVQLPLESHGYLAKESRRHVIWEMVNWLDTHVKQPKKSTSQ